MKKTAVVILNWNGRSFLEKFLPEVVAYSSDEAEVIVADNASSDDSVDFLKENYPDLKIIQNPTNSGYAGGYNEALAQLDHEYFVLLNSDIEVTEGWIKPIIDLMDSEPEIAACQPKIRSFHDKEYFEYAGAAGGFIDKYGYPFCRGRVFQKLEKDEGQYDDITEVFWATGACMFVRAELFIKLNGLDADFFAHMEEIDLCWRFKNAGYKIMYHPGSMVYHVGGGTLPNSSSWKTYLNFRNNFLLLYKNLPKNRLFKMFASRLFLDGIAGLKFLAQGGLKDLWAVIRAHLSFYASIRTSRRKRKLLNQKKVSMVYQSNIAFDHYIWRVKKFSELQPHKFTK